MSAEKKTEERFDQFLFFVVVRKKRPSLWTDDADVTTGDGSDVLRTQDKFDFNACLFRIAHTGEDGKMAMC